MATRRSARNQRQGTSKEDDSIRTARRSTRKQPQGTTAAAAAKVPINEKINSTETLDDSIRTIPKRLRKGKVAESVDADDSEGERPVRKRATNPQIAADALGSAPEVSEKSDTDQGGGRPVRNRGKNTKEVAKRNIPSRSAADAEDVPSWQPDGTDEGEMNDQALTELEQKRRPQRSRAQASSTAAAAKSTEQQVAPGPGKGEHGDQQQEHQSHDDDKHKLQHDVKHQSDDDKLRCDDDVEQRDVDDEEQRDVNDEDLDDEEQHDVDDEEQRDVDEQRDNEDDEPRDGDGDGEEHDDDDDEQQEPDSLYESRSSPLLHDEQDSSSHKRVRRLWENHWESDSAGPRRLSDRLFESDSRVTGAQETLERPPGPTVPDPFVVRAGLAMQRLDRVLRLHSVHRGREAPDLDGTSTLQQGGTAQGHVLGTPPARLPKLDLSQVWKPPQRQQQTPRRPAGRTVTDSQSQQQTSPRPVPATATAGQADDNAEGGQQRERMTSHSLYEGRRAAAKSANERMRQQADDDASSESDGSDFIDTAAETEKKIAHHNSLFRGTTQELMSIDEEDTMLEEEFLAGTISTPDRTTRTHKPSAKVKRGRGALISPRPPSTPGGPTQFSTAHDDVVAEADAAAGASEGPDQEDEDEDDDSAPPPWHVKSGPLSKQFLQEAKELQNDYTARLTDLAQRAGVKVSTVLRAIGDDAPVKKRQVSGYNAFLACYAQDHPKPEDMTRKDYEKQYNAAYEALFEDLPEEDRNDDDARRPILQPWIDRFIDDRSLVLDDRKGKGRSKALLKGTIDPFIHQSMSAYKTRDHHVWGFAVDLEHDLVNMWGGSQTFEETKKRHSLKMTNYMIQMKALMQATQAELDLKAKGAAQQIAVFIDLSSGGTRRDKARLHLGDLFLNLIQLALMRRGYTLQEAQVAFPRMSWEWANKASKFQLRIVNWPSTLKMFHPGPGFKLAAISDKDKSNTEASRNKALLDMYDALVRVYRGETDADAPNVESWTEAEMDLERPTNVPLVVATDKSELMTSYSSKTLLRTLRAREGDTTESRGRKASRKDKGKGKAVEEQSDSPDDDRTHHRVKSRRSHNAGRSDGDDDDGDGDADDDADADGRDASSPPARPRGKARNAGRVDNATDDDSRARARNAKVRHDGGESDEDHGSSRKRRATDQESSRPAKRRNHSEGAVTTTGIRCRYVKGDQVSGDFHALRLETSDAGLQAEEKETWYLVPPNGWKRLPAGYRPVVAELEEPMRSLRAIEVGYS